MDSNLQFPFRVLWSREAGRKMAYEITQLTCTSRVLSLKVVHSLLISITCKRRSMKARGCSISVRQWNKMYRKGKVFDTVEIDKIL